jgi:UDP-N-acetyl-D-galactosamine dehydrogenase
MIHKAESLGYHPALIGAGRRINDNMGIFVANKVVKLIINKGIAVKGAKALILGITFKENCPDIRNTRVVDIYDELKAFGLEVDIYDPWADREGVRAEYGIELVSTIESEYQAVILAVSHNEFESLKLRKSEDSSLVIFDLKSYLKLDSVDSRL